MQPTLSLVTYATVALTTWLDKIRQMRDSHEPTSNLISGPSYCAVSVILWPTPSGSLHSVLPPVGLQNQVWCEAKIKSRGSHVY